MTAASRFPGVTLKYCYVRIGYTQFPYKLEFGPQGGRPSRALDMCNRSFPDPLGIVLWFDKLEFSGFAELTIDS